jgi:hypothetical protein
LVGVIRISPFESLALILPVEPNVSPRSKSDLPTLTIWSRSLVAS